MNTYYIFKINDHLAKLYKDTPQIIFEMLEQISKVNKQDLNFAYKILKELIIKFDKDKLFTDFKRNKEILVNIIDDKSMKVTVLKNGLKSNIICNFLYLKIQSDNDDLTILDVLKNSSNNLFFCDFKKDKYFWLNK